MKLYKPTGTNKFFIAIILLVTSYSYSQNKIEKITYLDGVETKTIEYEVQGYFIIDTYIDGKLFGSTRTKDDVTVFGRFDFHNQYGKYVAFYIAVTNSSSNSFNFLPEKHFEAYIEDKKGNRNNFLLFGEYDKIVKRRQNGSAIAMGLLTGVANLGAGTTYGSYSGNIGGRSFYSNYTSYSSSLARIEQSNNIDNLNNYLVAQSVIANLAKNSYIKNNTVSPNQTISGHILIPLKKAKDGLIKAKVDVTVNGTKFNYKKKFFK